MFCSLFGLSPCDIILQSMDIRVVRELISALNNRFDLETLKQVKGEFQYVVSRLENDLLFDYAEREDRVLARKLRVAGKGNSEEIERRLKNAKKVFTGNVRTPKGVTAVTSDSAKKILERLYQGRELLYHLEKLMIPGIFSDKIFFGRPTTYWAYSYNHGWLSAFAEEKIKSQDNLNSLESDAANMLAYVRSEEEVMIDVRLPEMIDLQRQFMQLGGKVFDTELCNQFLSVLNHFDLFQMQQTMVSAIITAFLVCMKSSQYADPQTTEALEQCGFYFMNPFKAEYMVEQLKNLSLVFEKKVVLPDYEGYDTYETLLTAILNAIQNNKDPVGGILRKEDIY